MSNHSKLVDLNRLIDGIKNQISIVDVAGRFMQLRKFGSRYKGLCPYHSERTPSFIIYGDSGHFKCFGCGKHGDVIDLWAHFNRESKGNAIRQLAEFYNVDDFVEYEPSQQEVDWFLDKKRCELKLLIGTWLFELEELFFSTTQTETEREMCTELMKLEYWYAWIDELNYVSLKALHDRIPGYLKGLYLRFWEGGGTG
ncbi:CHC2 zinc finger domain-containing protein [Cohnella sp. GCM10027633]|uniref:CHC2 zinc finger domain-containing protein n=1 Tax=unclassified Cohnella TaxID=2636738 RepID=UPI0036337619